MHCSRPMHEENRQSGDTGPAPGTGSLARAEAEKAE